MKDVTDVGSRRMESKLFVSYTFVKDLRSGNGFATLDIHGPPLLTENVILDAVKFLKEANGNMEIAPINFIWLEVPEEVDGR